MSKINNDIFNEYAKIALDRGLIKKEALNKTASKLPIKEAKEYNARRDSLSVKDIANLYNVKPEKPKDQEYERNISEYAHPEPVIFFSPHDKMNGLVENVNERQNIIINILRKMPNGNLLQKKYATSELALSLVRIGMDLDNANAEELRVLADTCTEQLQKRSFDFKNFLSEKGGDAVDVGGGALSGSALGAIAGGLLGVFGGPPAMVAGAALGAAAGGALAAIFKTSPQAKNVAINSEIARHELADLIQSNPGDPLLLQLDAALLHITSTASTYAKLVDKMHMPDSNVTDKEHVQTTATTYINELNKLNIVIGAFLSNAKSGKYAPQEADWWSKAKTPFTAIFGDDVQDEVKALETLQRVIHETQNGINMAISEAQGLASQAESVKEVPEAPKSTAPAKEEGTDYGSMMDDAQKEMESWLK